jgi:16S rRNA (uracil1498-N3)-methyltransferase
LDRYRALVHRFFVPREEFDESAPVLTGGEARHARVRRVQCGESVVVFDGQGREWRCVVAALEKNRVRLCLIERRQVARPVCLITLAPSLLPSRAMDWVVEKATELGVWRLIPVAARRSVSQLEKRGVAAKLQRWRAITIEAAKQCGAAWLPAVEPPQPWPRLFELCADAELKFIAVARKDALHPRKLFQAFARQNGRAPRSVAVVIGPEGDFVEQEISAACSAGGFAPVTLGALTLRSETAAVYALSALNYELSA